MFGNPQFPTYQVFIALGIAAVIVLAVMPLWIRLLKVEGIGQQVRADGPKRHLVKQGTPTMGGVVILVAALVSVLLMARLTPQVLLFLGVTLCCGLLGLLDDIESVSHGRSLGLTPHAKMIGLTAICLVFTVLATSFAGIRPEVAFPGGFVIDLGTPTTVVSLGGAELRLPWLYFFFVFLLMAGMSNAVNLTDGLDGLAGGTTMVAMLVMAAVGFALGDRGLAIACAAIAGGCIGFLWYNAYPASIFMGDTGSLALGGALAAAGLLSDAAVISLIVGGLFIIEALSVMIQVLSYHFTKRRVFLMAPLHHHFEKKGWAETKVVIRFWIVSAAFGALGFALFFQIG